MPTRILKHVAARTGARETIRDAWYALHDPAGRRVLKTILSLSLVFFGVPCLLNQHMFTQYVSFSAFAAIAPEWAWGAVSVGSGLALFFTRSYAWGFLAQFVALGLFGLILASFLSNGIDRLSTAAGIYFWLLVMSMLSTYLKAEFRAESLEADRLREARAQEQT